MKPTFDIEQFYHQARYGEPIDKDEVFRYISSFQNVILWGAGNLGTAVGKVLLSGGVSITEYWDLKAEEIVKCNEIPVSKPFSHQYDVEKTVIISCIANGSPGDRWPVGVIQRNGYLHYLLGLELFEGLGCTQTRENFDIVKCAGTMACSLKCCAKYINFLHNQGTSTNEGFILPDLTFSISTQCTLACKNCGQDLTKYPKGTKRNFDKENIFREIDNVMSSVDFIGMVSVIGGEPFVHPDLAEITEKFMEWDNFGILNITTNGIFRVEKETIRRLKYPRVIVSFSCYDPYLTEAQETVLRENIDLVKEMGVSYSVGHPIWSKPLEIEKYHSDESYMKQLRAGCLAVTCCLVRDGKFIPCSLADRITGRRMPINIEEDLVDVTVKEGLRERLIENRNKPFFKACAYCSDKGGGQVPAGEQVSTLSGMRVLQ